MKKVLSVLLVAVLAVTIFATLSAGSKPIDDTGGIRVNKPTATQAVIRYAQPTATREPAHRNAVTAMPSNTPGYVTEQPGNTCQSTVCPTPKPRKYKFPNTHTSTPMP